MHSRSNLDIAALTDASGLDSLSLHTSRSPATTIYVGRKRKKSGKPSPAARLLATEQNQRLLESYKKSESR